MMNVWLASERSRRSACALGIALAAIILTHGVRSTAATWTPQEPFPGLGYEPRPPSGGDMQSPAGSGDRREVIYSHWTKLCQKGKAANGQQVCFVGESRRIKSGTVAVVLIEPSGATKMTLRITLPLGLDLWSGTRIFIDQGNPMNAPYITCENSGCIADFEAGAELIDKLKQGRDLDVQGTNRQGQVVSLVLPLSDFGKAYDGPPADPN